MSFFLHISLSSAVDFESHSLCENNDRARLYLGLALKAKNDLGRARACFKQALEMNPNNIEASRELRLIDMRIQQRREEKAAQNSLGGLFNKFLKK